MATLYQCSKPNEFVNKFCGSCINNTVLSFRGCWGCKIYASGEPSNYRGAKIVKDCNTCETLDCNSCKGGR